MGNLYFWSNEPHNLLDWESLEKLFILGAARPIDFGKEKSLAIERSQVGQYCNMDPPAIVQSREIFLCQNRPGRPRRV